MSAGTENYWRTRALRAEQQAKAERKRAKRERRAREKLMIRLSK